MFAVGLHEWLMLTQGRDMWKLALGKGGTRSFSSLYWLKMIVKLNLACRPLQQDLLNVLWIGCNCYK